MLLTSLMFLDVTFTDQVELFNTFVHALHEPTKFIDLMLTVNTRYLI